MSRVLVAMLMGAIIRPSRTGRIDSGSFLGLYGILRENAGIEGVRIRVFPAATEHDGV